MFLGRRRERVAMLSDPWDTTSGRYLRKQNEVISPMGACYANRGGGLRFYIVWDVASAPSKKKGRKITELKDALERQS